MVGATTISTGPFDAISGIFETSFWLFCCCCCWRNCRLKWLWNTFWFIFAIKARHIEVSFALCLFSLWHYTLNSAWAVAGLTRVYSVDCPAGFPTVPCGHELETPCHSVLYSHLTSQCPYSALSETFLNSVVSPVLEIKSRTSSYSLMLIVLKERSAESGITLVSLSI